ncbi:MAG: hypothetical protein ABS81_19530 [Pseudonocardia sp. SCN 72-86]|nr:MAG: hypothetical protein ABS81_19530 [Pseudonocardia sp. SCN 72-86]
MTPEERAAYRAFVRDNHPDRGGDPDAFVAGLAALRAGPEPPALRARPEPPVAADDVVFVRDIPLPARIAIALLRTVRRHRRLSGTDSDDPTSQPRSAP